MDGMKRLIYTRYAVERFSCTGDIWTAKWIVFRFKIKRNMGVFFNLIQDFLFPRGTTEHNSFS